MNHMGMMSHFKTCLKDFKISKEIKGDKLIITFSGKEKDLIKLDKKIDAIHTIAEDCCVEGGCC